MTVIPTFESRINPGWLSTQDNKPGEPIKLDATGGWIYPKSPTTPYRSPGSAREQARYLLLDPRFRDADGRPGHDDWWFIIERLWPSGFDPITNDREHNFHNVAGDAGNAPAAPGGIGWAPNFGSGASSLALDFGPTGSKKPCIAVLTTYRSQGGFDAWLPWEWDEWNTYVVHWRAGRTDGSTVNTGLFQCWANGQDAPIWDKKDINTVQRAKSPADGQMYVQRWMALWEGDYTIGLAVPYRSRFVLTRIGKTLQEAIADVPAIYDDNFDTHFQAYGDWPRSILDSAVPQRDSSEARIPKILLGEIPVPEPPLTGDFTIEPTNPVVGQTVKYTVIDPKPDVSYGFDLTLDGTIDQPGTTASYAYVGSGTKTIRLYGNGQLLQTKALQVTAAPQPVGWLRKKGSGTLPDGRPYIDLEWDAVPDAVGYRFSREKSDGKFSHTFDGARTSARFSEDSTWYKVEALGILKSGTYTP